MRSKLIFHVRVLVFEMSLSLRGPLSLRLSVSLSLSLRLSLPLLVRASSSFSSCLLCPHSSLPISHTHSPPPSSGLLVLLSSRAPIPPSFPFISLLPLPACMPPSVRPSLPVPHALDPCLPLSIFIYSIFQLILFM